MNFCKKNIVKNITNSTKLSSVEAATLLESLLQIIKTKSKSTTVKISRFGSFSFKKTPKRLGRNPKTKDSYIIPELNKLNFQPSSKIKEEIN
tara:strand:- start:4077 stop:4352 length:276 start_codon:yes stop_codon:yes gene_type:complete